MRKADTTSTEFAAAGPELPRGCTNFRLRQMLRRVSRIYDGELAHAGLKGTQFSLLSHIVGHGPLSPGDLARRMGMDASTLTRNLRVLIDAGWAVQKSGADERSRSIEISSAGRAKEAEARRHWKKAQATVNQLLGTERVLQLHLLIDASLALLAEPGA
jgi:DNA-binding MarR family transcriptional regulator